MSMNTCARLEIGKQEIMGMAMAIKSCYIIEIVRRN